MPPGGLLPIWPVASLLGQSSIAVDTLLPSRLATGQIGSNERMRIYEIDHLAIAGGVNSMIMCMKNLLRVCLVVVLTGALSAGHAANPLPRSAPEAQGVSSVALLDFVNALDQRIDGMHSLMIVRRGQVIAEGWWTPYDAEHNHVLYSLSKSFTSSAVGFAVAEGKLSIDDEVLKFFPDAAPTNTSNNLKAMR